jgi:hypothetical protein
MACEPEFQKELKAAAAKLLATLDAPSTLAARAGELDALIHEAEAREHRRAAFNARDAACYRLGAAFEPLEGLDLDPVALTGWLALSSAGILLLARQALAMPETSLIAQLRALFASSAGRKIRELGVWVRWHWLKTLYDSEVASFLKSKAGRNPAAWRPTLPTARQRHLIAEICLLVQKQPQQFETKAEAFAWIVAEGGNPRFRNAPPRPATSDIVEAFK